MSESFKAVEFMRKRREQIDKEDQGLDWEQKARKTLEALRNDPLWNRLKSRVVEPGCGLGAGKESALQARRNRATGTRRRSR